MAPYDSDDSLDEDQDYTETDVLLGYASKEPNGETISKLGGRPEWLVSTQAPSYALAKCPNCSQPQVLLLQLNGDLPDRFPGHERRLYVFACRNKSCRRREGSIRALRAVRVSLDAAKQARERREKEERERAEREKREAERKEKEKGLGEALFGVAKGAFGGSNGGNPFSAGGGAANPFSKPGANPFGNSTTAKEQEDEGETAETDSKPSEDVSKDLPRTFAETLSLNNPQTPSGPPSPPEPWPADSELPPAYPTSYLSEADYETLDPQPSMPQQNVSTSAMEVEAEGNSGGKGGKEDKDVFESTIDSTFQKFADRLAQNPDQCIRYEFGGAPLLYSKTDGVGKKLHDAVEGEIGRVLPRCRECGGGRVFEVQLTPQAIVELEGEEELEGMDWGTVIVAVCDRDCVPRTVAEGDVGYVEEWAGVQWEELTARR